MAIMFVRAQVISRGAGRNIVSAAAYRHRTRMMDEQAGTSFSYRGGASELVRGTGPTGSDAGLAAVGGRGAFRRWCQ
ncbi:hypothetical protein HNP83_006006 [Rhizobium leguminosarum]|nr:hypothetical protein [Rhizobium leguminosarum]